MANVTITGTLVNSVTGAPETGRGYIEPTTAVMKNTAGELTLVGGVGFTLDGSGHFSVSVPATDDPTVTPLNFTYRLGLYITSGTPRRLDDVYFQAPAVVSPLDMADFTPVGTPVTPTQYGELDARLDGLESESIMATFAMPGAVTVLTGASRLYNDSGATRTIVSVRASVGTAPVGANLQVDVHKNGLTIFPTSTPPTINGGSNTGTAVPDVTTWLSGDYLTVDVVSIGSSVAGSNLTVTISYR